MKLTRSQEGKLGSKKEILQTVESLKRWNQAGLCEESDPRELVNPKKGCLLAPVMIGASIISLD